MEDKNNHNWRYWECPTTLYPRGSQDGYASYAICWYWERKSLNQALKPRRESAVKWSLHHISGKRTKSRRHIKSKNIGIGGQFISSYCQIYEFSLVGCYQQWWWTLQTWTVLAHSVTSWPGSWWFQWEIAWECASPSSPEIAILPKKILLGSVSRCIELLAYF